jgi:hypothetical protein
MHAARNQKTKKAAKPVKQAKRSLATKKVVKKKAAPVVVQQSAAITTTVNKSNPQLKPQFSQALAQYTAEQTSSPQIKAMSQQQRGMRIRSLQVAWTKHWLCRRGLFYEDIFEEVPDIRLAINILPADVRKDRLRRLIRSCDLDCKLVWLPEHMQQYDPMTSYGLDDAIMRVDLMVNAHDNYV